MSVINKETYTGQNENFKGFLVYLNLSRVLEIVPTSHPHFFKHCLLLRKGKEMVYLTTHSTHFIYGYMASDIWLRTILIVRKETRAAT